MDKVELRKWAKQFGKLREKASTELVNSLKNTELYKKANDIMIFYPLKNEVNLLSLLNDKEKIFYLPKIDGTNLLCCKYSKGEELCLSRFNTLEPTTPSSNKNDVDLIIVPALCCDKNNYRLGYGGGFYDRFLTDYRGQTIVCLPKELIVDTISPDRHDIKVDYILTI